MVALFAELDENASRLKRANDLRAAFLSNMSHEFRTPLNAILAISRLLLDRSDGELTPEQERQAGFIRRAAEDLSSMVNDLLDLARIEAGRIEIRPAECRVENLLSSLRGMFRPMLVNPALDLVFEEPEGVPALWTDEGKVSQILRNLVSNALKFTERGEVRVSAKLSEEGRRVVFSVADTGIGIPPEHLGRIFEEYAQVDSPLQRKVTGTGLGLPLSRKLAGLLGGSLTVESLAGQGSTLQRRFHSSIRALREVARPESSKERAPEGPKGTRSVSRGAGWRKPSRRVDFDDAAIRLSNRRRRGRRPRPPAPARPECPALRALARDARAGCRPGDRSA
jgi:signal transduction histidine kinase